MMWKFVITILIYCAVPSHATFGDFFKSDKGPQVKHVAPSTYSVPIFKYGPPQMKFNGHGQGHPPPQQGHSGGFPGLTDKFNANSGGFPGGFPGLTDKFNAKKNFLSKSISKVSHGGPPRFPINLKSFGGPKPVYGPPQRPRPQFVPQHGGGGHSLPQVKGHCDGWIPILGPSVHQPEHHFHPEPHFHHAPEPQLQILEQPAVLPEATLPLDNIVPHENYGVPGHVEDNSLHVVQSNVGVGVEAVPAVEELHQHHVEQSFGDVNPAPIIPNVLSNELSGGFDIVKSHGIELTNFNSGNSFNQLPPPVHAPMASYGAPLLPNHGPPINFRPLPQAPPQYHHKPVFHGPKNILGIRYGSVSGNLKPWPIPGTAPKYPLSFREPVPQGLIESIGHNVQHLDNYGVKLHAQPNIYLPPPPSPLPISSLHSLPLKHSSGNFLTHGYFDQQPQQQVAHESNQVAITHHHSCQHGPNLAPDAYHAQPLLGPYEAASSNNLVTVEEKSAVPTGKDISSYGPPASGIVPENQLPGLDGLNVISAQKSHTVELPTTLNVGGPAYDIQFQQSIASTGTGVAVNHDQLVNNGLLQSIITAVEQPQQQQQASSSVVHTAPADQRADTSDDVKIVFNSTQSIEAVKPKADN